MSKEIPRTRSRQMLSDQRRRTYYPSDLVEFLREASLGVVAVNRKGVVTWANRTSYEGLGYSREDFEGKNYADLVASPEEAEFVLGKVFQGEVLTNHQVTLRHRSGDLRTFVLDADAVRQGKTSHARLITRDITGELKTAEASRLRGNMLDAVGQAVIATDVEGRIEYWNRAAEQMYGWTAREVIGRPIMETLVPERQNGEAQAIMKSLAEGHTWAGEFIVRRKDGSTFPAFVSDAPLEDEAGNVTGYVGVSVDLTELWKAREESERVKSQLDIVLRGIADGVTAHDRTGRLVYANDSAVRLIGYSSVEELLLTPVDRILDRFEIQDVEGTVLQANDLPAARARAGEVIPEQLIKFRDRQLTEERYALVQAAPILDSAGQVEYVVDIFRDVTDKVILDKERERLLSSEQQARLAAERAVARMAALQEVTALLSKALTQQEVSEVIVTKGVAATCAVAGTVALIDGEEAYLIATTGCDPEFLARWKRFELSYPTPLTHSMTTGEDLFFGLHEAEERYPDLNDLGTAKAWASAPIRAADRVIGAISFSFPKEQAFLEEDRHLIRTLATLCAQALDRARLYEVERSLRSEAQISADLLMRVQRVTDAALAHADLSELPELLETIRQVIQSDTISILLLDETDQALVPVASLGLEDEVNSGVRIPLGAGFSGMIARSREPCIVDNPEEFPFASEFVRRRGLRSVAGIPLVVEGRLTGVLYVGMCGGNGFNTWHVRLLELVADRVALALAQSRLLQAEREAREEAERVRERVSRLQSTTATLAGAWTPQEAAQVVLQTAVQTLQADSAAVATLDDEGRFEILGAHGYTDEQLEAWRSLSAADRRPLAYIVSTGQPLFFSTKDEFLQRFPEFDETVRGVSTSSAWLPLTVGSRILGCLTVGFGQERKLGEDDRRFLVANGQQCALAIARTELYEAERQARAASEDAEARYRLLAETMPLIVWTATAEGTIDYCNARFYEFTGLAPSQPESWVWEDLVHPDDSPGVLEAWRRSLETGVKLEIEARFRRADGSYCWFLERALPLKDAAGASVRWLGTMTDIDDQKRAQERLSFLAEASGVLSSSLDYEHTLKRVADLVVDRLADWCAVHVAKENGTLARLALAHRNPEKLRLAEEMEDREPLPFDTPFSYAAVLTTGRPYLVKRRREGQGRSTTISEWRRDRTARLAITSSLSVPVVVRGEVMAALTLAMAESKRHLDERDLETAREFARHIGFAVESALLYRESQAVQAELRLANEAKDEFLGLMSHELRTPITTLYGGAKILRSRSRYLDEEQKESLLNDIEEEAEGMHRMIEDLLVLARAGTGERVGTEPILANRLVEKVVRGFQLHKPARSFQIRCAPDLLPVMAETTYVEQILRNLLSNADKYSPPHQLLEIELRTEGEEVVFAVLDRGSGIDPAEADLIFNRFYRAERTARGVRGMGLGLTVCKKLVEAQGGRIWALPRDGGGTEVAFSLPAFAAGYDDAE